jgi:hypothetical protein
MLRSLLLAIATAGVVACASAPPPQTSAQAPIAVHSGPVQPGTGVVVSAAASPGQSSGAYVQRLEIRMDNGVTQYVDVPVTDAFGKFWEGMRVQLTANGQIRRLS